MPAQASHFIVAAKAILHWIRPSVFLDSSKRLEADSTNSTADAADTHGTVLAQNRNTLPGNSTRERVEPNVICRIWPADGTGCNDQRK